MKDDPQHNAYRFGEWVVNPETLRITSASCERRLQPRAFAVLMRLLESPGEIVSIEALLDSVWHNRVVEPGVIHWNVNQIRKNLEDDPKAPRYIETVAKRGYRAIAPVERASAQSLGPVIAWNSSIRFEPRSMAVLPFENLSPDPGNAYFAAGIYEETLNQLSKIKDFPLVARVLMGRYAMGEKTIQEIGQALNVSAVMSGGVRFAAERVRISAQLVSVSTGALLWSEIYDRELGDIFAIQSDIAEKIADAMRVSFDPEERQVITAIPTENLEAYSAYLKGLAAANQMPPDLIEGVRQFESAIRLDPTFADALGAKAMFHATLGFHASRPEVETENFALALSLAQRALARNPHQTTAELALSHITHANRRWDEAIAYAQRAYERSPNAQWAALIYAEQLSWRGDPDSAIPLFDRAVALSPLNPNIPASAALNMAVRERWDDARRYAQVAIDTAPNSQRPYIRAAWIEALSGNVGDAASLLREAEALAPSIPPSWELIQTYVLIDRSDAADHELQKLVAQEHVSKFALFFAHLSVGALEEALHLAHTAVDDDFPAVLITTLAQQWALPILEPLHGHPGFIDLLDKLHVDHGMC